MDSELLAYFFGENDSSGCRDADVLVGTPVKDM